MKYVTNTTYKIELNMEEAETLCRLVHSVTTEEIGEKAYNLLQEINSKMINEFE